MAQAEEHRNALADLRRRFRAALAWRLMTAEQFAETCGVTPYHLGEVLAGRRKSPRVLHTVWSFVADFQREVAEEAESGPPEPHLSQMVA